MIKRSTGSITLRNGQEFTITYEWIVLWDTEDYKIIIWELTPNSYPQMVSDSFIDLPDIAESYVKGLIQKALVDLIRGTVEVSCVDCED